MRQSVSFFLLITGITITAVLPGCNNEEERKPASVWPVKAVHADSMDIPHAFSCASVEKLYSIDMQELNGYYAKVFVYVANADSIYEINKCIQLHYEGKYKEVLSIWYLDKKHFAKRYVRAINDRNLSDDKFEQMDKH
jgi:hypothetical protein